MDPRELLMKLILHAHSRMARMKGESIGQLQGYPGNDIPEDDPAYDPHPEMTPLGPRPVFRPTAPADHTATPDPWQHAADARAVTPSPWEGERMPPDRFQRDHMEGAGEPLAALLKRLLIG